MKDIVDTIMKNITQYGLVPVVSLSALFLGGYGCWQASLNEKAIQRQALEIARTEAKLDEYTREVSNRMGSMEKTLIELTTQIKLLVDGKLVVK